MAESIRGAVNELFGKYIVAQSIAATFHASDLLERIRVKSAAIKKCNSILRVRIQYAMRAVRA
jgi:hypothetical protein